MADNTIPKITSIMLDCNDIDDMIRFWGGLLELEVRNRYESYVWMSKINGDDTGLNLAFQRVPEPKTAKLRMHLDGYAEDFAGMKERVFDLGGTIVTTVEQDDGFTWTVFADPEGNEFCIAPKPD